MRAYGRHTAEQPERKSTGVGRRRYGTAGVSESLRLVASVHATGAVAGGNRNDFAQQSNVMDGPRRGYG